MNKLLTVAIPTYNRADKLEAVLKSLMAQNDERIEIIISDNASEDDTESVAEKFRAVYPEIIYIKNNENKGAALNQLQCIKKASGKYVFILCDDDILCSGAIAHIIDYLLSAEDLSLVFLNHVFFRDVYIEEKLTKPYLDIDENITTKNKTKFMEYAGMRITYTSAVIYLKKNVMQIENPEQYKDTRFMSACLALLSVSDSDSKLGIISFPCVADNLASNVRYNGFQLFGINVKNVLCDVGGKAGFDRDAMDNIYKKYVFAAYIKAIANARINRQKNLWHDYGVYVLPAVKKYPLINAGLRLALLVPRQVWYPIKKYYSLKKYGR